MAKTCPGCGYHPIGPFVDNCPMCAEPIRHRETEGRRGRLSSALPTSPLARVGIGVAVVVAVCVVLGALLSGLGKKRPPALDPEVQQALDRAKADAEAKRAARTESVTAARLLREFGANPDDADRRYRGRYLEIIGTVERTGQDGSETPFVILHAGDENAKIKIECFFDEVEPKDEARLRRLTKGQEITVRGEYEGRVSNLQIRECVLVK